LQAEADLSPRAAERICREAAREAFAESAKSINIDWQTELDGKQIERWSQALGRGIVRDRDRATVAFGEGRYPQGPVNDPQLLVIGMDGGRWQGREKNPQTNSRWHEEKVLTVTTYIPGDGRDAEDARKPAPLVRTYLATARDATAFGTMARVEAEKRGYRQARTVIAIGDGGNWIDPLLDREFRVQQRIIDWYHAVEHVWDCASAVHEKGTPQAAVLAKKMEAWLWDGKLDKLIAQITKDSENAGDPKPDDPPQHPRVILKRNIGYFTTHRDHMNYPAYRAAGWPIGSGETEAVVKQFNKRVKGTEQFWHEAGIEPILAMRSSWLCDDTRWQTYWANRPAYVN
jgi:hypothetical protein